MNWKPELDDLARREAFAREMGGVDKVKRQRDQGRLTVRERIDKLTDQNTFHEVGAISGVGESAAISATNSSRFFRNSGSPPVSRTVLMPRRSTPMVINLTISSSVST